MEEEEESGNITHPRDSRRPKRLEREACRAVDVLSEEAVIIEPSQLRDKGGHVIFRIIHVGICSLFPSAQTSRMWVTPKSSYPWS